MTEYHCWVVLRYHSHDTDLDLQAECEKKCEAYLTSFPYLTTGQYKIIRYNGLTTFMASALHNHNGEYIIEIFQWLGENAIGSYGLLHFNNDEVIGSAIGFRLFVMKKGQVSEQVDKLLSPRIPTIEDEYEASRDD